MIITILSEPRSGSSNLSFWFGLHNECTVFIEPSTNPIYKKYRNNDVVINDINYVITIMKSSDGGWNWDNKDLLLENPQSHMILNPHNSSKTFAGGVWWKYPTKHLVIKEICYPDKNYKNILQNSDKVIILFRENYIEQKESWLMSVNTEKWGGHYFFNESLLFDKNDDYLIKIKKEIEKYKTSNNFIISYEELYFRDGIKKLINYIGIKELEKIKFPIGSKYRRYTTLI